MRLVAAAAALAALASAPAAAWAQKRPAAEVATSPQDPFDSAGPRDTPDSNIDAGAGFLVGGLWGSAFRPGTGDFKQTTYAGAVGMDEVVYLTIERFWSLRGAQSISLGWGGSKPLASIAIDVAFGRFVPLIGQSGVVARVGLRGGILSAAPVIEGSMEVPQVQIGYQIQGKRSVLELGARGAISVASAFDRGDSKRHPGVKPAYSAYLGAHHHGLHLDVELTRIDPSPSQGFSPIDIASGSLCGTLRGWGACLTGRYLTSAVQDDDRPGLGGLLQSRALNDRIDIHSLQVGVLLGVGIDATYKPEEQPEWLRPVMAPPPPQQPPVTVYQGGQ